MGMWFGRVGDMIGAGAQGSKDMVCIITSLIELGASETTIADTVVNIGKFKTMKIRDEDGVTYDLEQTGELTWEGYGIKVVLAYDETIYKATVTYSGEDSVAFFLAATFDMNEGTPTLIVPSDGLDIFVDGEEDGIFVHA